MNYLPDRRAFAATVARQRARLAQTRVKLYPGIGASSEKLSAVTVAQQIIETRQQATGGFVIFEYNEREARYLLPELAKGLTRPEQR